MFVLKNLALFALAGGAFAVPFEHGATLNRTYECGEPNVIFTGLPGNHPLVWGQGFNGTIVQAGIEEDTKNALAAGYNVKVVLMGPEQPMSVFDEQVGGGQHWDGVGMGYGVRGSRLENLTIRAEELINYYHRVAPLAPMMFDLNWTTAQWAMERNLPIEGDCTNTPGTSLGFEILCDVCDP